MALWISSGGGRRYSQYHYWSYMVLQYICVALSIIGKGHAVKLSGKCKYRYLRNAKHPPDLPIDGLSHDTRGDMQNDMHGIIL